MHTRTKPEPILPACSKPVSCRWCAGNGFEPDEQGLVKCEQCGGSGYAPACGDCGTTRTYKARPFTYSSGSRRLRLKRGKSESRYKVVPLPHVADGRGFEVRKQIDAVVVCHHVFIGRHSSCDCEAGTYATSEKADRKHLEVGDDSRFPTLGCVHLDALSLLLAAGHLDIPATPAPAPYTDADLEHMEAGR